MAKCDGQTVHGLLTDIYIQEKTEEANNIRYQVIREMIGVEPVKANIDK